MDKKIKFYCVLFDSVSFNKFKEKIISVAEKNKMTLLRQIGGCSTQFSCIEMLTGKMLSDLKKYGIGFYTRREGKWDWEEDFITNKFLENRWSVKYHNGRIFLKFLSNNSKIELQNSYKKSKKPYLAQGGKYGKKFFNREKKYIKEIQKEEILKDTMYFMYYEHIHLAYWAYGKPKYRKELRYAKNRINLLMSDCWDFNEPNSVFWFFGDHGNWNLQPDMRHPKPQMYYSWAMVKDNTDNPINIRSNFISIRDFFPTLMNKFEYNFEPFLDIYNRKISDTYSIEQEQDRNRIYYVEDARKMISKNGSTTAMACRLVDWKNNKPTGILQVSYHLIDDKWDSKYTSLDYDTSIIDTVEINNINYELKQFIINRFKWVNQNGKKY